MFYLLACSLASSYYSGSSSSSSSATLESSCSYWFLGDYCSSRCSESRIMLERFKLRFLNEAIVTVQSLLSLGSTVCIFYQGRVQTKIASSSSDAWSCYPSPYLCEAFYNQLNQDSLWSRVQSISFPSSWAISLGRHRTLWWFYWSRFCHRGRWLFPCNLLQWRCKFWLRIFLLNTPASFPSLQSDSCEDSNWFKEWLVLSALQKLRWRLCFSFQPILFRHWCCWGPSAVPFPCPFRRTSSSTKQRISLDRPCWLARPTRNWKSTRRSCSPHRYAPSRTVSSGKARWKRHSWYWSHTAWRYWKEIYLRKSGECPTTVFPCLCWTWSWPSPS